MRFKEFNSTSCKKLEFKKVAEDNFEKELNLFNNR